MRSISGGGHVVQHDVEILTADETGTLTEFFSHGASDKRGQLKIVSLPDLIDDHPELAAKVGALAIEVIQERLPGWGCVLADGTVVLSREVKRTRARRVVLVPRHLLTINWADSGPGFSWPEGYHATFIPGFGRFIVTASRDCPDLYDCCDHAIGWFDSRSDWKKASTKIVKAWWSKQRDCEIGPWTDLLDPGSLGKAETHALCDAIWPEEANRR